MEDLVPVLGILFPMVVSIGICVVLPIIIVWIIVKNKRNETNRRAEVMLAAIEKNASVGNMEEILKQMAPPQPTVREKTMKRMRTYLMCGVALTIIGAVMAITLAVMAASSGLMSEDFIGRFCFVAIPALAFGIGMLLAYRSAKKSLEKDNDEPEAGN